MRHAESEPKKKKLPQNVANVVEKLKRTGNSNKMNKAGGKKGRRSNKKTTTSWPNEY